MSNEANEALDDATNELEAVPVEHKDVIDAKEVALEDAEMVVLRAVERGYEPDSRPDMNAVHFMYRNSKSALFFDTYQEEYPRLVKKLFAEYTPEAYEPKNKTWDEMVGGNATPDGSMKL